MRLPRIFRRNKVKPPLEVLELMMRPDNMEIVLAHPVFAAFCTEAVELFYDKKAVNFLDIEMWSDRGEFFIVTIRRKDGKMPGQVVAELKERIAELEAQLTQRAALAREGE